MKIKFKISLFITVILLFFSIFIILILGFQSRSSLRLEVEEYRNIETEKARQILVNYVNLAFEVISKNEENAHDTQALQERYGDQLTNIVEIAESIIHSKQIQVTSGLMGLREAETQAAAEISRLRFDGDAGYIWINNTEKPYPRMIMHPMAPALN
ncbi:MAG: cache domain-containing protein [Spirochaetales bacterium]|nr:cache domain-containing protein [Spirochaetales bacterium]